MSTISRGLLRLSNRTIYKPVLSSQFRRISTNNVNYTKLAKPSLITLSHRYNHYADNDNIDPRTRDYFYDYRNKQASNITASTDFDPTNTKQVFQSFSTYQLIKYNAMFSLLSFEALTNMMIKIMINIVGTGTPREKEEEQSQSQTPITMQNIKANKLTFKDIPGVDALMAILGVIGNISSKPLIYLVRKQYFPLFTGGENIDECIRLAKKYYDQNIRLIIDNSTEEGHTREIYAHNLALKKELVDVSYDKLQRSVVYMAIKMTALSSPTLLEEMTSILYKEQPSDRDPTPFMTEEQLKELDYTMSMLTEICQYAKDKGIGVWLDAEQYSRQPAMNYLSRRLMQIINTDPNKIYLYNTYQCYLKESHDWIAFDIEHAKSNGYTCGIKLVRGAYLDYESKEAQREKRPNPIHNTKEDTDRSYDGAVRFVMNEIVLSYGNVGIAVCTHNRASLQNATDTMEELGIERDDPSVVTAQLNGMVDNLTYALGYSGYNALKLIPYGAFDDVWPFLMRRFEENSQILNGSQQEKALYGIEIKRRLNGLIGR